MNVRFNHSFFAIVAILLLVFYFWCNTFRTMQRYNKTIDTNKYFGRNLPKMVQISPISVVRAVLFCLNIVNGILRSSAPALDDNGEQGYDEAGKPSSEYPEAERDAITIRS